jgi:hypothetical protein
MPLVISKQSHWKGDHSQDVVIGISVNEIRARSVLDMGPSPEDGAAVKDMKGGF